MIKKKLDMKIMFKIYLKILKKNIKNILSSQTNFYYNM